jgi:hypothetical protein
MFYEVFNDTIDIISINPQKFISFKESLYLELNLNKDISNFKHLTIAKLSIGNYELTS